MKYILCIEGGGIGGYAEAEFLSLCEDLPEFDLVAGTSIGGILTILHAAGWEWSEIIDLFDEHAKDIFTKKFFPINYKYKSPHSLFSEYLEDLRLQDLNTNIFVPGHEWYSNKTKLFKNNKPYLCADVCCATSAAPTYFPPHRIREELFIDPGLYMNNPAIHALTYAFELWPKESYHMLNIGAGRVRTYNKLPKTALGWIAPVIKTGINGSEETSKYITKNLRNQTPRVGYTQINFDVTYDMDDVKAIPALRDAAQREYERIYNQKLLP